MHGIHPSQLKLVGVPVLGSRTYPGVPAHPSAGECAERLKALCLIVL